MFEKKSCFTFDKDLYETWPNVVERGKAWKMCLGTVSGAKELGRGSRKSLEPPNVMYL
jgi:hypothetical protein